MSIFHSFHFLLVLRRKGPLLWRKLKLRIQKFNKEPRTRRFFERYDFLKINQQFSLGFYDNNKELPVKL